MTIPKKSSVHRRDRKSTRLNSSHLVISYAVFCLKKKTNFPGQVAVGIYPNSCDFSHIVTCTPHKSLRRPRWTMILATQQVGPRIAKFVLPGTMFGSVDVRTRS